MKDRLLETSDLKPLTFENQLKAFNFIYSFRQDHDFGPTIREIGEAIGVDSTSQVKYTLKTLHGGGYISYVLNGEKMRAGSINYKAVPEQVILAPNFKRNPTSEE